MITQEDLPKNNILKNINLKKNKRKRIRKLKNKFRKEFDLKYNEGKWTEHEHDTFFDSCLMYGNNWPKVN